MFAVTTPITGKTYSRITVEAETIASSGLVRTSVRVTTLQVLLVNYSQERYAYTHHVLCEGSLTFTTVIL